MWQRTILPVQPGDSAVAGTIVRRATGKQGGAALVNSLGSGQRTKGENDVYQPVPDSKVWALFLFTAFGASLSRGNREPQQTIVRNFDAVERANRASLPSRRFALADIVEKRLPPLTKDDLKPKPKGLAKRPASIATRADLDRYGRWDVTLAGKHLWRFQVQSPEAPDYWLHSRIFIPAPEHLWLHDGSGRVENHGPVLRRRTVRGRRVLDELRAVAHGCARIREPDRAPKSAIEASL